eukprot:TRINITY_DN31238_c0_g1_i1.p1 TRINITY_DN31238_c0_g1~~TRINITY_DN31238_c0_g1_i1.p1  ORF type:complete len:487 (+),score=52.31 TRINITY_DN31238_c0_g1_i1:123-1583(+)
MLAAAAESSPSRSSNEAEARSGFDFLTTAKLAILHTTGINLGLWEERPCFKPRTYTNDELADFLGVRSEKRAVEETLVAHASQFVSSLSAELAHVSLPFINQAVGGNVITYGHARSLNSLANALGGVFFGRFGDLYGPKASMFVAHCSAFAHLSMMYYASSQTMLYAAAVPCVSLHCYQAAQMVAVKHSDPETRMVALGRLTLSYCSGHLAGLAVLTALKGTAPSVYCSIGAACELGFLVYLCWADDGVRIDGDAIQQSSRYRACATENWDTYDAILRLLATAGVKKNLLRKVAIAMAGGLVVTLSPQIAAVPFGFSPFQLSLLVAYTAVARVGAQVLSNAYLNVAQAHYPDELHRAGSALTALSLAALAVPGALSATPMTQCAVFVLLLGPIVTSTQVATWALTADLTNRVSAEDMNLALGFDMASGSLATMLSPLASAYIVHTCGFASVGVAGAGLACMGMTSFGDVPSYPLAVDNVTVEKREQ